MNRSHDFTLSKNQQLVFNLLKEEGVKIIKNAEVTEIISNSKNIEAVKINKSEIINL